jgi:hypothetical protein
LKQSEEGRNGTTMRKKHWNGERRKRIAITKKRLNGEKKE